MKKSKDLILLGSAVTNIFQAINSVSKTNELKKIRKALQNVTIEAKFFKTKFIALRNRYLMLESHLASLQKELSGYANEIYKLQKQQELKDDEISKLKEELDLLKKQKRGIK